MVYFGIKFVGMLFDSVQCFKVAVKEVRKCVKTGGMRVSCFYLYVCSVFYAIVPLVAGNFLVTILKVSLRRF